MASPLHPTPSSIPFPEAASRFHAPTTTSNKISLWLPLAIWTIFLAGLLLQLFSPHLQIAHNAFVIPQDAVRPGMPVDPRSLVQLEKSIQIASALLVLAGATGLALFYRRTLLKYALGKAEN